MARIADTAYLTTEQRDALTDAAYALGHERGRIHGGHYFDGEPTQEQAARTLLGIIEADWQVCETFPSFPLSGEWADSWTPDKVLFCLNVRDKDDLSPLLLTMFEDGYEVGASQEIESICRAALAANTTGA